MTCDKTNIPLLQVFNIVNVFLAVFKNFQNFKHIVFKQHVYMKEKSLVLNNNFIVCNSILARGTIIILK